MAGRTELIQTVIISMLLYWMMIYHMPMATFLKIDSLCGEFLWVGKSYKISWTKLCRPKKEGGIGLKNILDLRTTSCLKLI